METPVKEIRNTMGDVLFKSEEGKEENKTVEGYALLFNVASDGLSFEETIESGALDGVVEKSDVLAFINHNMSKGVLARCKKGKGSLTLSVDQRGLKYSFIPPDTDSGKELRENILRGEIDSSSVEFTVEKDTWTYLPSGKSKRVIHKISMLYAVCPVYDAAYSKTTVSLRGKEDLDRQIQEEKEARQAEEKSKAKEARGQQFKQIETQLSKF